MNTQLKNTQIRTPICKSMDEDDDEDVEYASKIAYKSFHQQIAVNVHHYYISDEIGAPSEYVDMIHTLHMASDGDIVYIHLNTPGGRLDAGVQILNAMINSSATVVTILESTAFSMGTILFLAGHQQVVYDHSVMMFHNWKGGSSGEGHKQLAQVTATANWYNSLLRKICAPFLTPDEITKVIKGEDLWLQSTEITKRLQRIAKNVASGDAEAQQKKPRQKKAKLEEQEDVKQS